MNRQSGATLNEARFRAPDVVLNYAEGPATGPPLVLLHGGSARWQSGRPLGERLAADWHVYAPDLRGHGGSGRTPGHYAVRDNVADVAAFLNAVVGSRAVVFGHSRGGQVGVMLAAAHPGLVAALIVGDAPLSPERSATERPEHRARNALWQRLAGRPTAEIAAALREMPVLAPGAAATRPAREVFGEESPWFAFQAETLHVLDADTLTALLNGPDELLAGYDPERLLPAIHCPVLLLQADPALGGTLSDDDVRMAGRLLGDMRHVRLTGVDHALHGRLDQLDAVVDAVLPFLDEVRKDV